MIVRDVNFHNVPSLRVVAKINWTPSAAIAKEIDDKNAANVAKFNEATRREFEKAYIRPPAIASTRPARSTSAHSRSCARKNGSSSIGR